MGQDCPNQARIPPFRTIFFNHALYPSNFLRVNPLQGEMHTKKVLGYTIIHVPKVPLSNLISMEGGATSEICGETKVEARPATTGAENLQGTRFFLSPGQPPILFKALTMIKQIELRGASQPHLSYLRNLSVYNGFDVRLSR